MKAICIATHLSDEQRRQARANPRLNPEYQITLGKEYLVFGLAFIAESNIYGSASLFEIEDDAGRCISTPSVLFKISDPTPSKWWLARQTEMGFKLWPEEFYADYFHDDLSEGVETCINMFEAVKQRLEAESGKADGSHCGGN